MRDITFRKGAYEFLPVPWAPRDTIERARRLMGKGYDYWGLLMTQFINMRRHNPDRWFCSKLCAKAMGLADPHTYAPGDLKRIVEEHNRTYYAAQELASARKTAQRPRYGIGTPINPGSGTFAGGLLTAREGAQAMLAHLNTPGPGGLSAIAPLRVAKRTDGLVAERATRVASASVPEGGQVVHLSDRVAR
ncbi:MAG: hypothetical protein OXC60_19065 [Litoreibacter sp.]|nr:hypothetical protein [Litoreibacter sp.]